MTFQSQSSPRRRKLLLLLLPIATLFVAAAGTFIIHTFTNNIPYSSSLRHHQRQLSLTIGALSQFSDPKSIEIRSAEEARRNCQIIYLMGVEGVSHHGIEPVITQLAQLQVDEHGIPYEIIDPDMPFILRAIFGLHGIDTIIDDPLLVQHTLQNLCPNDGKKRILMVAHSFPSKSQKQDWYYRTTRQNEWRTMTMDEIAESESALNHPTNLYKLYDAYSPFADVKFVVLHRPFMETVASHPFFDGGVEGHSNVIGGYLKLFRTFLDSHRYDHRTGERLWSLLCIQHLASKFYENEEQLAWARRTMVTNLATFLNWPVKECDHCFDTWVDSEKDPVHFLKSNWKLNQSEDRVVDKAFSKMKTLEGIWPPDMGGEEILEQQCTL